MLPTAPVPAAPARLDPLLMPRSSTTHLRLGAAVCDMRVLLLGLSPLTAAAAVMLAGCGVRGFTCLLYTSPSPRDKRQSRMPSSA